jgi:hypothetical protein
MRTGFEELRGGLAELRADFRKFATRTDTNFGVLTDILKSIRDGFGRHDAEITELRGVPYVTQPILYFSVQTASDWAVGFTGQVDGLRIQLTDSSVANVNFEPFVVATDKEACKINGWKNLHRADGSTFKNQGDCIQYVNTGK